MMTEAVTTLASLQVLADRIRESSGIVGKKDIATVVAALDLHGGSGIAVGDDAAAIPSGDGWQLIACEGMVSEFVEAMPWFAGWSAVMVNVSDICAMGGRPTAVVNALWSNGDDQATDILLGMKDASRAFGVRMAGGHSNLRAESPQLSVSILGQAKALMTSFDAKPGDCLIHAVDLRGAYHDPYPFWDAATKAPVARLQGDIALLPTIAEDGLCRAAKDISQGGLIGTAIMLAECSDVGLEIDLDDLPMPPGADLERWLTAFPSFGYLMSVSPNHVDQLIDRFLARDIAAACIGSVNNARQITIKDDFQTALVWDLNASPLIGCAPQTPNAARPKEVFSA